MATVNLIPPESCPGTFDIKPDDAAKIKSARIFMYHPFQSYLLEKVRKINPGITAQVIKSDPLTTPEGYFNGLAETESVLGAMYPKKLAQFDRNRQDVIDAIMQHVADENAYVNFARKEKFRAAVSVFQKDFIEYLGFTAVTVFASSSQLSAPQISAMVNGAKAQGAKYIISNLTGDNDTTAEIINRPLRLKKAVLVCFPGTGGDKSYFINLWDYNIARLKQLTGEPAVSAVKK
jgi:zinc transport system substrate-binding protein